MLLRLKLRSKVNGRRQKRGRISRTKLLLREQRIPTATLLPNGTVLVGWWAGGENDTEVLASAEIFYP